MKRLVVTGTSLFDINGRSIGKEVIEAEAFTREELNSARCSECGAANGAHSDYFVQTGSDGFGSVQGFHKNCTKMTEENKLYPWQSVKK